MITKENFKILLETLGFSEDSTQIYTKTFDNAKSISGGGNTALKVDFKAKKLIYPANTSANLSEPNGIIIHDDTTSNFSHSENFVVFECVHRLLDKGYKPEHIELEPRWNLGREAKGGKADILVRDNERNPYLLIECKTAGSEFSKEWNKMQQDGGQLFSYFQQERGVKFLCLYMSDLATLEPSQEMQQFSATYQNYIIHTQDNNDYLKERSITGYAHATNNTELFSVWREVYKLEYAEIGIFERNINAYEAGKNALCFEDLQELSSYNDEGKTYEDGKYHEFAKILRKYNISGKENAFDKLVNLFLCKIYDENHNKEILRFCYRGNVSDSLESMQDRLMLLYKEAMREFLSEEITYISNDEIEMQFSDFKRHKIKTKHLKEQMQEFIRQLKFYSHSDFSFLEVHNKELFLQNGEVLKSVVKLFEKLKLTQNKTNQLLGNLFELFLQKGMKQDEGQFFTPMPICEFIIHSLPLESMLIDFATNSPKIPKVIDYACGAGHFLNTYANIITQNLPQDSHKSIAQRRENLDALFSHIYGIEKEYRLSKVAKVAAAMFSQEKINITYADALDFAKFTHKDFDLLISNPPYSVKGFAETLSADSYAKYELSKKVSDKDSFNAIECFFIERANELLASNAKLAIILPSSILNKGGIYENTREIILRNFEIVAIVELGSATFGATGTNTIILFANKRETYASSQDSQSYLNLCENIADSLNFENVYLGQFLRAYCYFMDYKESDFSVFVRGKINENLAKTPTFNEYKKAFSESSAYQNLLKSKIYKEVQTTTDKEALKNAKFAEFALEIEKDKLLHFALIYQNEVLIIKSPSDNKEQKKFLGYEWSNRKGDEGLKELNIPYTTPLFDRANPQNPLKLNTLIKNAFLKSENSQIPPELQPYARKARLVDMLDFTRAEFSKAISLNPKNTTTQNPFENSKFELVKLGEAINENPKSSIQVNQAKENIKGKYPFYTSGLNIYRFDTALISGKNIFLSTGGNALVQFFDGQCAYSTDTYAIKSIDEKEILTQFIYLILQSLTPLINEFYFKGMGLKHLQKKEFKNIQIPKPPLEIQKQIVSECESIESKSQLIKDLIALYRDLISAVLAKCGISESSHATAESILSQITTLQSKLDFSSLRGREATEAIHESKIDCHDLALSNLAMTELLKSLPTPPQQGWERVALDNILTLEYGKALQESKRINGEYPVMGSNGIIGYHNEYIAKAPTIIVGRKGSAGKLTYIDKNCYPIDTTFYVKLKTEYNTKLLYFVLGDLDLEKNKGGVGTPGINRNDIYKDKIPLPPLNEQEKISSCIESIESKINALDSTIPTLQSAKSQILQKYLFANA